MGTKLEKDEKISEGQAGFRPNRSCVDHVYTLGRIIQGRKDAGLTTHCFFLNVQKAYLWQCCCCSHINSHNQVRSHRTGFSHSGAEKYPREKHTKQKQRWYTHISQLTQFMPPPETYKSEIGSQPTMCLVHTGTYVALLATGKPDYIACHPENTTTHVLHVVPITTHTHNSSQLEGIK